MARDAAAPVELTADSRFAGRIIRLAATSLIALGLIWGLQVLTLEAHLGVSVALAAGWVLMPTLLGLSLRWPALRYGLTLPSVLVSVSLIVICLTALPTDWGMRAGWLLITAGILMGGVQGIWFWFRFAPVPRPLGDAFSAARWTLIGIHVSLIVIGLLLVGVAELLATGV